MLQKIIIYCIYLIVFSLPLYLVSFKIGWIPFTLLEIMIYCLFGLWLILKTRDRKFRLKLDQGVGFWLPIFLIFLGVTISTWLSDDIIISAGIWKGWFIAPLLFLIVLINYLKSKEQIKNIFLALTLSGFLVALISIIYWLNNNLTYDGRVQAFYLSPNYLAMYLSPILILSVYLYSYFKKKSLKIILFAVQCFLFVVIYLTFSYGAWLGLCAAFVFILFFKSRVPKKYFFVLLIILVCLSFFDFSIPSSLESRFAIWQSAWEIIKDHPLFGIGPGMFQEYYLDYQPRFEPYPDWAVPQPHNLFMAFWLQTGLLGLIGFVWLLIKFFKISFKKLSTIHYPLFTVLMATMVYILIHGLIDTTFWKNDLSVIFWLITGLSCIANRPSY